MKTGRDHQLGAPGAEQIDRAAGDGVRCRCGPSAVADVGVSGEEGGEVAEVGGALQGSRLGFDGRGLEAGALQLVEQPLERDAAKPALSGGSAQRAQPGAALGDRRGRPRPAAGPAVSDGTRRGAAGGRDRPEEAVEGGHRRRRACRPRAQSSRWKRSTSSTFGTTSTGSRSSTPVSSAPDPARATGVGGSVDQVQRHPSQLMDAAAAHPARKLRADCPALPSTGGSKLIRRWLSVS